MSSLISVVKRTGQKVKFDSSKIESAILKAGKASGELDQASSSLLTTKVVSSLSSFDNPSIEMIQDEVEKTLLKEGYLQTARKYIAYREHHSRLRESGRSLVDVVSSVNDYVDREDWRVSANANQGYSLGGLILNVSGKVIANYWLNHIYSSEIKEAHVDGSFHIHDLDFLAGYCFTGDTKVTLLDGSTPTLQYLAENRSSETFYVLSLDINNGCRLQPGLARLPRLVSSQVPIVSVLLPSSTIRCTPDHQFLLSDGTYKEAQYLTPSDKLASLIPNPSLSSSDTSYTIVNVGSSSPSLSPLSPPLVTGVEDVYCLSVDVYNNFLLSDGVFVHNCAGWSLRSLLEEGFNGVPGKIEACPPKHLSSAIGQMVNFLGTLQNEFAGAQAFSSFDTYLAPFVRLDNLSYSQVKQNMQEFIYNLNVPSRWGCVPIDTEVLTPSGFKTHSQLKEGDLIYSWKDQDLHLSPVNKVVLKHFSGYLHSYSSNGYCQTVTPEHRVLFKSNNSYSIKLSSSLFFSEEVILPSRFLFSTLVSNPSLTDEDLIYAAKFYSGASSPLSSPSDFLYIRENYSISTSSIDPIFLNLGMLQSRLFLLAYGNLDLDGLHCPFSSSYRKDQLQHLAIRAGLISYSTPTSVIVPLSNDIFIQSRSTELYSGLVWCPSVDNGTAIYRRGGSVFISGNSQSPFTNITFDIVCPEDLSSVHPIIGGEEASFTYGSLSEEMSLINKAYIEVMLEGDSKGRIFTFPIPTYNITPDFPWDSANSTLLFEMAAKYGLPYFQNFLNSDLTPKMVRSMCCRLQLDLRELIKRGNGLFGSSEQTGSIGVVTINCARLGYLFKGDEPSLFFHLDDLLFLAKESLEIKRKVIQKFMNDGLFPYSRRYLGSFRNHFSTIGVNGINEMILNFTSGVENISTPFGYSFSTSFLDHIRSKMILFQEETGHMYNLEATPAEGCLSYDTLIHTSLGNLPIGSLVGRTSLLVHSFNESTLNIELKKALWIRKTGVCAPVLSILLDSGQKVVCTPSHPFAVSSSSPSSIYWTPASSLTPGDRIKSNTLLPHSIVSISPYHPPIDVYNMEVEDNHNYFVGGDNAILLHNCTYRFAKEDKKRYSSSIIQAGTDKAPYYTNSSQLPVSYTDDPFLALEHQESLQRKYTGGTVFHMYLGERVSSPEACKKIVKNTLTRFKIPYLTISPTFSVCPIHGYLSGEHRFCPKCDALLGLHPL